MLESVIGHGELKGRLSIRLEKSPVGTYLFHGPPSTGKRTTAFAAAKHILCDVKSGDECSCRSCKKFDDHPDFLCVGRHEKIKVADVERILDFSTTTPFLSKYKIIILDNAHNITWEAANRLLKLLEEPPPNYAFFLVSENPQAIIPTIISRCIKFEFNCLSQEDLADIICTKLGFDPHEAEMLGGIAAETSMDIFSNAGKYLKFRLMSMEFLSSMKRRQLIDSLDYIDKIEKTDLSIFCDLLLMVLTDVTLVKNGITDITNNDMIEEITKVSDDVNGKALIAIVSLFSQLKRYHYLNINLNLNIKNTLIKSYPLFMVAA
jgi:DNA polymerase-3 subunit delta'